MILYFLLSYIAGVGVNPGEQTMYHMCKTWLQKVHSGWDMGGDFEIKIYKINYFLSFISCQRCRRYSV